MKDNKGITVTNVFQKIVKESNRKPNKIWVDKGSESYNRSMKSWLEKNAIEMYSTYNEGKSIVAERCIRTLKNKTYKYITSISKNVYTDKLDDIVGTLERREIFGMFNEKNCKIKTSQKEFRVEKLIKRKGDKLYVKLKD